MLRVRLLMIVCLALLTSCAKAEDDCGYVKDQFNQRVSWKNKAPITMYIHASVPAEFREDVLFAASVWNYKRNLIIISPIVEFGPAISSMNSRNVIYYLEDNDMAPKQQAVTKFNYRSDLMLDADIVINAKAFQFYPGLAGAIGSYSMRSLLIHEMGHALGLDHNSTDGQDVMFPSLRSNTYRIELTNSNKKSINCEY